MAGKTSVRLNINNNLGERNWPGPCSRQAESKHNFVPQKGETYVAGTESRRAAGRGQRHSAAWGKRLSMLLLLLVAEAAFAQSAAGWLASSLRTWRLSLARAHQVQRPDETVQVIVQYKQVPQSEQEGKSAASGRAPEPQARHGQGHRSHDSGKRAARFGGGPRDSFCKPRPSHEGVG